MNEYICGTFIILAHFTTAFYLVCNRDPKGLPCPPLFLYPPFIPIIHCILCNQSDLPETQICLKPFDGFPQLLR